MYGPTLNYSIDLDGEPFTYGSLVGDEASEAWYLYQYMREIVHWREFSSGPATPQTIPRREKYFLLHAVLHGLGATRVTELGSSLMEVIDGLEATESLLWPAELRPAREYFGIERSPLLAKISRQLHQTHRITVVPSTAEFRGAVGGGGGVLYDRIISSFAFRDVAGLAEFLGDFDAGILNLLASQEETFVSHSLGSDYTYFSLAEMARTLPQPLYHLFGHRAPKHAGQRETGRPVVEGFFFYGSEDKLGRFLTAAGESPLLAEFFAEKRITPRPAALLIGTSD